jgi:hypothetical protein
MLQWLKNTLVHLTRQTRLDKRRKTKLDGQLLAKVGAVGWPAQVIHLSTKKVRIVLGRWQKEGSAIALALSNQRSGFSCIVQGRVAQIVLRPDGMWDMRCTWDQPLDADMLAALVQP